ncbi:hypothetical protein ACO0QE_001600 [Hanseniaspora vineae]
MDNTSEKWIRILRNSPSSQEFFDAVDALCTKPEDKKHIATFPAIIQYVLPFTPSLPEKTLDTIDAVVASHIECMSQLVKGSDTSSLSEVCQKTILRVLHKHQTCLNTYLSQENMTKAQISIIASLFCGSKLYNFMNELLSIREYSKLVLRQLQSLENNNPQKKHFGDLLLAFLKLNPTVVPEVFFDHWIFGSTQAFENNYLAKFYQNSITMNKKKLNHMMLKYLSKTLTHENLGSMSYVMKKINPLFIDYAWVTYSCSNEITQYMYIISLPARWLLRYINYLFVEWGTSNIDNKRMDDEDIMLSQLLQIALNQLTPVDAQKMTSNSSFMDAITQRLHNHNKDYINRTMSIGKSVVGDALNYSVPSCLNVPWYKVVTVVEGSSLMDLLSRDNSLMKSHSTLETKFDNLALDEVDSDDDDEHVENVRGRKIIFLKDLIEQFSKLQQSNADTHFTMKESFKLIMHKKDNVSELEYYCDELVNILLKLSNEHEHKDFEQLRVQNVTAILNLLPRKITAVMEILLTQDLTLQQRLSILTIVGFSAQVLSGLEDIGKGFDGLPQASQIDKPFNSFETSQLSNTIDQGSVVWRSRKLEKHNGVRSGHDVAQKTKVNRFNAVAPLYFWPLINGWLNGIELGTFDYLFKSHYINTLAMIFSLSQAHNDIVNMEETCFFSKGKVAKTSIGVWFLNVIYKTNINLSHDSSIYVSKIRFKKKKIDNSNHKTLVLDLVDVTINITEEHLKSQKAQKEKKSGNSRSPDNAPLKLEVSLEKLVKQKKIIQYFASLLIPLHVSLQKISLVVDGQEYYIDYAAVKLVYSAKSKALSANIFLHEFTDYKGTYLKHFEFNISTSCKYSKESKLLSIKKWSTSLRLSDFTTSLPPRTSNSEKTPNPTSDQPAQLKTKKGLFSKLKKLEPFWKAMNVVDLKFENITVAVPQYSTKFHCANMIFSVKSLTHLFPESKFEMTLSSNSLYVELLQKRVVVIPLMNVFSTSDRSLNLDFNTINCTMGLVDSKISFGYDHLKFFLHHTGSSSKSQEPSSNSKSNGGSLFDGLPFPKFNFKFLLPNFSIRYMIDENSFFIWKNNEISMHLQHSYLTTSSISVKDASRDALVRINQPTLEKLTSSNYIKFSDSSLTFKYENSDLPIAAVHKIELQNTNDNPHVLNVIVKNLHITLNSLKTLTIAKNNFHSLQQLFSGSGSKSHTAAETENQSSMLQKLEVKFQLIDFSCMSCISGFLPVQEDVPKEFYNTAYGVSFYIDNAFVYYKNKFTKGDIDNVYINKVISVNECEAEQTFVSRMQNITFTDSPDMMKKLIIPQFRLDLDICLLWMIFYMKTVFSTILAPNEAKNMPKSIKKDNGSTSATFDVQINVILIKGGFANDLKLLFTCYDLKFQNSALTFKRFHILTHSVYVPKQADDIYVRLFVIDGFKFNLLSKVNDQVIDIQTKLIQLRAEYHLRFYTLIDRIVSTVKTIKQLKVAFQSLPQFKHVVPVAEDPKHVPRIRLRTRRLVMRVEEDPFEHDLGVIYRVGLLEQKLRLQKTMFMEEEIYNNADQNMSDETIAHYKEKLYRNFSRSWIERIKRARELFTRVGAFDLTEKIILGSKVKTLFGHEKTSLFLVAFENLDLMVKEPNFGVENFADFIWKYGKHVPKDTKYTTLIPMNISWSTDLLKFQLRDYLLPILSFSGLTLDGDVCFAEQDADYKNKRSVWVPFIKQDDELEKTNSIFGSHIIRTLNSVKTFMNVTFNVDHKDPSIITWGKSLQPAYQAVMIWFDYFTKPPLDPSPKIGFWDKFRLLIHGKMVWNWSPRSELHLNIKGSSDPYKITDDGAGLTFAWREGTCLTIHGSSDPKDFLVIKSKGFLLGIRDFTTLSQKDRFRKALMQLKGDVTWKAGLLFEAGDQAMAGEEPRTSHFKNHYSVDLINPKYTSKKSNHDSYAGFRSDFIHMSIGVYSDNKEGTCNSAHLAPTSSDHFKKWWHLFGTYTSGPIRQGPLFSTLVQNPKKFGSSLFTIKYSLSLAPLEISHIYRHPHIGQKSETVTEFTGLKGKVTSFKFDLHHKRLKMLLMDDRLQRKKNIWKLKIDQGEVDCKNADVRLMSAEFNSSQNHQSVKDACVEADDLEWYNFFDFIDLEDFELRSEALAKYYTIPLLFSPRISYFRNIDRKVHDLKYPFGSEDSHDCMYGKNHPEETQRRICQKRINELEQELRFKKHELNILRQSEPSTRDAQQKMTSLSKSILLLKDSKAALEEVIKDIRIVDNENTDKVVLTRRKSGGGLSLVQTDTLGSLRQMKLATSNTNTNTFDNRFMIHNILLKINGKTKNLLTNYFIKLGERKAATFYVSHKSLSIVNEMLNWSGTENTAESVPRFGKMTTPGILSNTEFIEKFEELIREVADEKFQTVDNILIKLILPQIQVSSTAEKEWAAIIAPKNIEVGLIDVVQNDGLYANAISSVDSVRETRYCTLLSETNFYVLNKESVCKNDLFKTEGLGYGVVDEIFNWPPWIPLEACYQSDLINSYSILKKTDMFLTFTKPNPLFFDKVLHSVYEEDPVLRVGFPELHITSNAIQYNAIYNIAEDIMKYGSTVNKKLENLAKTILANELKSNFKLSFTFIMGLQNKIRDIHYQRGVLKLTDPDMYNELCQEIEAELQSTRFELIMIMSSLKKNFAKMRGLKHSTKLLWIISADDIIWEMYHDNNDSFITFGLGHTLFQRTEDSDGANTNKVSISSLRCFNLQQNPVYVDLLAPYEENGTKTVPGPLLEILWFLGTPVGGISDLEDLTIRCRPIRFQMDHITLNQIIDFLFTTRDTGGSKSEEDQDSPSNSTWNGHLKTPAELKNKLHDKMAAQSIDSPDSLMRVKTIGSWDFENMPTVQNVESNVNKQNQLAGKIVETGDGMEEMVNRSSKYINIRSLTIRHMTVCVSYRGSKSVITNVDNLIVKVPTISYKNKIWSTSDFIATLKKDIIKVVLHHTGTIIGNKFKPKKKIESKYESFKQLSKLLKNEVKVSNSEDTDRKIVFNDGEEFMHSQEYKPIDAITEGDSVADETEIHAYNAG